MADDKGNYGTRHVMEEEMRVAGQGVFEAKSAGPAPSNKMEQAPANKSLSGMTKAELVAEAERAGIAIETDDNKADLIAKIEKARG